MGDVKANIFNCGRKLFSTKGFKNTNVSDITEMAGVGTGTFYKYYTSKEQLFFEIYKGEKERIENSIMEYAEPNDDPITLITKLFVQNINALNTNLILNEWYNEELFNKLEQLYNEQSCIGSFDEFIHSDTVHIIKNFKDEGKIRGDINDDLMLAILNSLYYIDAYKKEIGVQHFPQILHYITEFIIKGLIESSN